MILWLEPGRAPVVVDAMIDSVRRFGWVDEQGSVRAHIAGA